MLIPADFIAVSNSQSNNREQQLQLLANCFAQSQALMEGKNSAQALSELLAQGVSRAEAEQLAPHKAIPGSRPSSTLLLERLTPHTLGALIALYEHKVYAHSVVLGINAFDQWGVELGKIMGTGVYQALASDAAQQTFDASTTALIQRVRKH
jgi:glucose-6-phosphate isomerase